MTVAICGMGVVGGFGSGVSALKSALTGSRAEPRVVSIPTRDGEIPIPCLTADTARLAEFVATRTLRRMSHYIRLGLLAAFDAMADARILEPDRRGRLGIIVATGHGATGNNYAFQYPFADQEEICGSPIRFSNSVHNAAAAYISIALKEMGPNHSITHDDLSFPSALLTAVTWLRQGRVDAVLVGGVDELNHAHAYAWHVGRQRHRAASGAQSKSGAVPLAGEGACFFVLKAANAASPAYANIREIRVGRYRGHQPPRPAASCYILGSGGAAATRADYGPWIGAHTRRSRYASIYGDLPVDSAFDTAIAALCHQNNCLFADDRMDSAAPIPEPLAGRSIACLKLGVGDTFGWSVFESSTTPCANGPQDA